MFLQEYYEVGSEFLKYRNLWSGEVTLFKSTARSSMPTLTWKLRVVRTPRLGDPNSSFGLRELKAYMWYTNKYERKMPIHLK